MSDKKKIEISDLYEMWREDVYIDQNDIAVESLKTPKLHSKYVEMFIQAKMYKAKKWSEYYELRRLKFKYYRGEMTREELKENGWEQYQGLKPIKSDMDEILNGDEELVRLKKGVEYYEAMYALLESIMQQIRGRDWQIKNHIEAIKFNAGV